MAGPLNATVVLAKCTKTKKLYGMRMEERGGDWVRTWAFPIDEQKAKREGFTDNKISGTLQAVDGYPGCPYCGAMVCFTDASPHCGKMSCFDGGTQHTCPWCEQTYGVHYADKVNVSGGGY